MDYLASHRRALWLQSKVRVARRFARALAAGAAFALLIYIVAFIWSIT